MFEMVVLGRRELDSLDALIRLAVAQSNLGPIVTDHERQLRYAGWPTNPGDDVRRPIRVAALSRTLGLPFETVRRRVARLCEAQKLVATSRGLVVPAKTYETQGHRAVLTALDRALHRTYLRLRASDFFVTSDLPDSEPASRAVPLRAMGRLAGDYYLRMLPYLQAWAGDSRDALILLCVLRMDFDDPGDEDATAAEGEGAQPLRPGRVARLLGLSPETVRRRFHGLSRCGICSLQDGGLMLRRDVMAETVMPQLAAPSEMNLRRVFRALARVGATRRWERIDDAAARPGRA
ncbi:MAG: hypothetical protein JNL41_06245 [Phenylobacterium sp.]|nr:hypothetical protein [Phenylobacterium sp.]